MIGDRAAALAEVDGAVIHQLLAGPARLAGPLIVGPVPCRDAQSVATDPEMLVEPVAAHRRRRNKADRLVVLAQDLVSSAVLPWRGTESLGPGVGVTLAFDANEHGRGSMLVPFGISPGLVLSDPQIESVAGHRRLDPAVAGRPSIIER